MPSRRLDEDVENKLSQKTSAILFLHVLGLVQGFATQYPEPFQTAEWASWLLAIAFGLTIYWWVEAAGWYGFFAAVGEFCYHTNMRTPRWCRRQLWWPVRIWA